MSEEVLKDEVQSPTSKPNRRETYHYFIKDRTRRIDFVLAYQDDHEDNSHKSKLFEKYLSSLQHHGLQIERTERTNTRNDILEYVPDNDDEEEGSDICYVLVHGPIDVLHNLAEDLKMRMPTKLNDIEIKPWYENNRAWTTLKKIDPFRVKSPCTQKQPNYFVATFDKERLTEFSFHDDIEESFTPAERGRLVYYVLQKAMFGSEETDIGIEHLVHKDVFLDAFPLHDGITLKRRGDAPVNERQRLQKDWASVSCLFKYQPIDSIREYFGEKVALYFAWLGFYTMFLIPASFVGILCFIYGIVTATRTSVVKESCSNPKRSDGTYSFYMCPLCDKTCSYFLLKANCLYAKVSHTFDNEATFFFAVFMSIWATLFLEFWKRRSSVLAYKWHSIGVEKKEEQVRPEYAAFAPTIRKSKITGKDEHHVPQRTRLRRLTGTTSVVMLFVSLVIAAAIGVIVFRAVLSVALLSSDYPSVRSKYKIIVSLAAGFVSLLAINVLKFFYNKVAVVLTDWENPRTCSEYEDSFTLKMFLFQFVNTYSSIFYVAFFKTAAITGSPGNYRRFGQSQFRLDGCSAQGCFLELTIQLIIIMVGQQFISNILEVLLPTLSKWWKYQKEKKKALEKGYVEVEQSQWVDDFEAAMQTKFSLFWEYLEIVLQYGFVTMFVAAFPLAPLCALINNIFEIRVDAFNYVHNARRPIAQRAEDIGAWYAILKTITNLSVLVNAFVLAFTSELIPSLVYRYRVSPNSSMEGYVEWSLSTFNVADFKNESTPLNSTANGIPVQSYCRYPGFHEPVYPYGRSMTYWVILSIRLSFVLCFVILIILTTWVIDYCIPDIPKSLDMKIKREEYLAAEAEKEYKIKAGKRKKNF